MILSEQANFLFIHVEKTGGSSIRRALKPYVEAEWSRRNKRRTRFKLERDYRRMQFPRHAPFRHESDRADPGIPLIRLRRR